MGVEHVTTASSTRAWRWSLASAVALMVAFTSTPPAADAPPRRVVILNDGDPTLPAFVAINRGLLGALNAPGRPRVDTHSETLDMMRYHPAHLESELAALLAKKHAGSHVDVVVAMGVASLDFAEKQRGRLWPDARILFMGVPVELLRERTLSPTTTGMPLWLDIVGILELAVGLRPETRRLVVVSGSGDLDRMLARLAGMQLDPYANRLPIEYWSEFTVDELVGRIAGLDRNDAVVFLSVARDRDGRAFVPREVLGRMAAVSRAPIYAPFETYLGQGAVAGTVYSFGSRGRRMGELVHEVLALPAGTPVPLVGAGPSACVADAGALERFGLSEARLPAGCEIRFASPSLWRDYRWYTVAALSVVLAQSALIAALVMQRRRRRRAEDEAQHRRVELARASRLALAGELTASIAHEINQPLGAILANAGAADAMLRKGQVDGDELRAILADIRQSDLRASEIIRSVRALVSNQKLARESVDVNALTGDVLSFLAREASRREVAIETTLAPGLPALAVDRIQLQQALVNLCVNAMDAMDNVPPGRRRLGVRTTLLAGGGIEIAVSDTGPGISPELLRDLFDSFFTTKPHGLGLGLAITRSIVEAHGGTLTADNRDGGGALFRMTLPQGEAQPSPREGTVARIERTRAARAPAASGQAR
jgi:signal transduction histidine kinase